MGIRYRETYVVKNYEVDRYKRMSLAMLARIFLNVSTNHSHLLYQEARDVMAEEGLTWFILQHDFKIKRMPVLFETIEVETEALSYNRFFTLRAFRVYAQGELIVDTLTKFAVVDLKKRQMVRIKPEYVAVYGADPKLKVAKLAKIEKISPKDQPVLFRADYSHIDYNQHVNNAVYFDWLLSGMPEDFLASYVPSKVSLLYEQEVVMGQEVAHYYEFEQAETPSEGGSSQEALGEGQVADNLEGQANGQASDNQVAGSTTTKHLMQRGEDVITRAKVDWVSVKG